MGSDIYMYVFYTRANRVALILIKTQQHICLRRDIQDLFRDVISKVKDVFRDVIAKVKDVFWDVISKVKDVFWGVIWKVKYAFWGVIWKVKYVFWGVIWKVKYVFWGVIAKVKDVFWDVISNVKDVFWDVISKVEIKCNKVSYKSTNPWGSGTLFYILCMCMLPGTILPFPIVDALDEVVPCFVYCQYL